MIPPFPSENFLFIIHEADGQELRNILHDSLTLRQPDDWHVHLRDGAMMRAVLPYTAKVFRRAVVMPNLNPPVVHTAEAVAYRKRIQRALPDGLGFTPLMTAYVTEDTDVEDIKSGFEAGVFAAAKLYPAGATTNSENGVTDVGKIENLLSLMSRIGMPLLIHGEVTDPTVDIFDREKIFIDTVLRPMIEEMPKLKVVLEHITTAEGIEFVRGAGPLVAGTITPHHLVINRNALFAGGLRPHMYCLPVAKRERHRLALRAAATSGEPSFFLGTDSAPHPQSEKESDCGCAGIFNAPSAVETYVQVFEEEDALENFEAFASLNGPKFYGIAPNEATITLVRQEPEKQMPLVLAGEQVMPFKSQQKLYWSLVND